jgi:hypothetical protein
MWFAFTSLAELGLKVQSSLTYKQDMSVTFESSLTRLFITNPWSYERRDREGVSGQDHLRRIFNTSYTKCPCFVQRECGERNSGRVLLISGMTEPEADLGLISPSMMYCLLL